MYFTLNDDGTYELRHPGFADVSSEDFEFVAQYLESGDFGLKHPEGEEVREAFAQMIAAWSIAETVNMTDLLDHVVDKMERLAPWDMCDVLAFAIQVYKSADLSLPAQQRMKDLLSAEIARHYWSYLEDEQLNGIFIQRLKQLPELERDVYTKRIATLNQNLQPVDDDMDDNEMN